MNGPRRNPQAEAGQALAELAVVVSLMLIMMVSLFDLGRGVLAYMAIINGARDGARVAMDSGATDAAITSAARGAAAPYEPSVSVSRAASSVTVTLTYVYQPITPLLDLIGDGGGIAMSARMVSQ